MAAMAAPRIVAGLVLVAGAATSIHLALAPGPLAGSSATVVALGILIYTSISVAGLLLSRGRWSRVLGVAVVLLDLAVVTVTGLGVWAGLALGAALLALGGLTGRWLDGWVRRRPSIEGPPSKAVVLTLGLLGLVPAVGLASPSGLETGHGVLGAAGVLLAWAYARAQEWSLWAIRLTLPFLAIPAVLASPWPGAIGLTVLVAALVVLAWSRDARVALVPVAQTAPDARRRAPPRSPGEGT